MSIGLAAIPHGYGPGSNTPPPPVRPRCHMVHGFNDISSGTANVDRTAGYWRAAGYEPVGFDYGWRGLLGVRFGNKGTAKKLAERIQPGDIACGHSNGCAIIHLACAVFGAPLRWACYINPALNRDQAPAEQVQGVDVWHSPSDRAVWVARFLPWHAWGDQGAVGFVGTDPRVTNFDKENDYAPHSSSSHSDVFSPQLLPFFGPRMASRAPVIPTP